MLLIILSLIPATFCFVVAVKQHTKKGVVINNRYIFGSKKEREEKDWTDYYNQSRNTFTLLGLVFLSQVISWLRFNKTYNLVTVVLLVITCIYAIVSGYKLMQKHGI